MHFKILTSCRSLALSVISVVEGGGPYNYNRNDINFGSAFPHFSHIKANCFVN